MEDDGLLRVNTVIEPRFRHLFQAHAVFNHMQSAILHQALKSDDNMVVAAPTGSGKTVIHEVAIVRLLSRSGNKPNKIVYVAPNKALCQQRMNEWEAKFTPLGQTVLEVTGDIDFKQCLRLIAKATVIVTTPEKWDSLTRTWKDHVFLLGAIDLLLIDEVHHLAEDRGATLEALVVRMRMLSGVYCDRMKASGGERSTMRIIALSATLPNLADIGEWLGCRHDAIHYFDETFRPVPLTVHTLSMGSMNNPFLFDKSLDERVAPLVVRYSEGRQVLVFCASKRGTETLSALLAQRLKVPPHIARLLQQHRAMIDTASDAHLRELLHRGMAYHHAGLPPDDRALVEQLYLAGAVYVLCSTSTLAHGVNLPAHLVIIKGTSSWRGGTRGYERTSKADIIQMLGRAGRPGMDAAGVAVIMTSREDQEFYSNVSLNAEVVESRLQSNLVETICAEVTQSVINSVSECVQWMRSTFFYIRVRKNPVKYGFGELRDVSELDALLTSICTGAVGDLARAELIQFDQATQRITANHEATVMTRNLIRFPTMDRLVKLPALTSLAELLVALSRSQELDKPVRRLEKNLLNDLMKAVRFPMKQRVQEPWLKSYVLLQAAIGRIEMKDFALRVEQAEIVECGLRVLAAVRELATHRGLGKLLESAVLLDRALRTRLWESNYGSVFLQCPGLQPATLNSLNLRGVRTIGDVLGCSLGRVQEMAACSPQEARSMLTLAAQLYEASREVRAYMQQGHLKVEVRRSGDQHEQQNAATVQHTNTPTYQLIVYHALTGQALCVRSIPRGASYAEFTVPCPPGLTITQVQCSLLSNYVGIDAHQNATTAAPNPSAESASSIPATASAQNASNGRANKTAAKKAAPTAKKVVDTTPVHSLPQRTKPAIAQQSSSSSGLERYYPSVPSPAKLSSQLPQQPQQPVASQYNDAPPASGSLRSTAQAKKTTSASALHLMEDMEGLEDDWHTQFKYVGGHTPGARHDNQPSRTARSPALRGELATLQRKADELDLHRIPVKRIKSSILTTTLANAAALHGGDGAHESAQPAAVVSPQSPKLQPRIAPAEVSTSPASPFTVVPPERWYQRVAPQRRSFFDDSDDPVIPAAFDFAFAEAEPQPSPAQQPKPQQQSLARWDCYPPWQGTEPTAPTKIERQMDGRDAGGWVCRDSQRSGDKENIPHTPALPASASNAATGTKMGHVADLGKHKSVDDFEAAFF